MDTRIESPSPFVGRSNRTSSAKSGQLFSKCNAKYVNMYMGASYTAVNYSLSSSLSASTSSSSSSPSESRSSRRAFSTSFLF